MAELLTHQGEPHVFLVLVAVAHDEVPGVVVQRQYCLQLRLAAALEADTVCRAELHDLLDHVPLLIDLDRIDESVGAFVLELLDRNSESLTQCRYAGAQYVGESQQKRQPNPLRLEVARQLEQIELAVGLSAIRTHDDMPRGVHIEESDSPPLHVVQLPGVFNRPDLLVGSFRGFLVVSSCGHRSVSKRECGTGPQVRAYARLISPDERTASRSQPRRSV